MNDKHPITPPTELVEQWYETADNVSEDVIIGVANRSAKWGADQELEACCEWIRGWYGSGCGELINGLRAARRPTPKPPEPPSEKEIEQFLESIRIPWILEQISRATPPGPDFDVVIVRAALEKWGNRSNT